MLAGIKEILIISTPTIYQILKNYWVMVLNLGYLLICRTTLARWIAQAFIIGEEFIGNDDVCLVLGDNIFYGSGLQKLL